MCTYWQIAAGDNQRDYSCLFLKYGRAFTGPGAGLKKVKIGDIMVLKKGITAIIAAGVVVERNGIFKGCEEEWRLDYDGWDLPEYCYVDWKKPSSNKPVRGLNRGTLSGLHEPKPKGVAKDILSTVTCVYKPLPLPSSRKLKDDEILKLLIKEGLRPSSSDELTGTISKIRLLADYYYKQHGYSGVDIGEHEIRTFLVVPLLLAMGWSEQQMKIEFPCEDRKRVDIACFRTPCKNKNREEWKKECVAIIETKSFGSGLDFAHKQAKTYSKHFPRCQAVITTNGYCYKVYLRKGNQFQETPSAYINLLSPRDNYLLVPENVRGALEAIKWLLPNNLISMSYQNTSQRPE